MIGPISTQPLLSAQKAFRDAGEDVINSSFRTLASNLVEFKAAEAQFEVTAAVTRAEFDTQRRLIDILA